MAGDISLTYFSCMDFSADCTILTAMISRVQSYEKLKINFPAVLHHLECDTLMYIYKNLLDSCGMLRVHA